MERLVKSLEEARIEAEPVVVESADVDRIVAHSQDAALVFLPFRLHGDELFNPFGGPLDALTLRLPVVALVLAAEDIELDVEPEEGTAGNVAEALDALADAEKRARQAEKDATEAAELAEGKRREIREALASDADGEAIEQIRAVLLKAIDNAKRAARHAAKALSKAENAAREVEALGVIPASKKKEKADSE
jgi:hypothetical protein